MIGWDYGSFEIPKDVYESWDKKEKGSNLEDEWNNNFKIYKERYPKDAYEFERRISSELKDNWILKSQEYIKACNEKKENIATRKASQNAIEAYAKILPEMIGGSADLAASNLTMWSGSKDIKEFFDGN